MESAVFGEGRDPEIDGSAGMQIGQDPELARFVLPLVKLRRVEYGDGDAVEEGYPWEGRRGRIVRDLEPAVEQATDRGQPVLAVDDFVEIGEGVQLFGLIVDLRHRRRHPVDAVVGTEKISGYVIVVAVDRAAVFAARLQGVITAAIHRN